ncbi:hypothetical protein D3C71_77830 [compost metagenome]
MPQLINTVSYVKRNIILIPFWVHEALKRNNLPLTEVMNFKKIREILSLQDLACFMALQDYTETLTGAEYMHLGSLYFGWQKNINANEHDISDFLGTIQQLADDASIKKEVYARLFDANSRCERHEKPYISYDLTPEFEGVVINPGFFTQIGDRQLQADIVGAMLKALYVYEPYNEVSKTPLFKRHLELLSA